MYLKLNSIISIFFFLGLQPSFSQESIPIPQKVEVEIDADIYELTPKEAAEILEIDILKLIPKKGPELWIHLAGNTGTETKFEAWKTFKHSKIVIEHIYRRGLAEALLHTDKVVLYVLDPKIIHEIPEGSEIKDYFLIKPYNKYAEILQSKKLDKEKNEKCRDIISNLLNRPHDQGAWGHTPAHGIRLYCRDQLIFETSISWDHNNYFMDYPDDYETGTWVGFQNQEELEAFIKKELSISQKINK